MGMLRYLRLAGFPVSLGLTSALVGGTLNRVMIVETGLPASFVGMLFAIPLLMSPLRVWLGYLSDAHPLRGLRREPYIVLGAALIAGAVSATTLALFHLPPLSLPMVALTVLLFAAYGLGKNLASNTFEALLADKFKGDQRPRAVTLSKIAMFGGIIGGSLLLGRLLDPFSPERMTLIVLTAMAIVFLASTFGSLRQEPREAALREASEKARSLSFADAIQTLILPDPQVRRFFTVVMLVVIGTLTQDVLLEPYGALALGMSVGQTARLIAFWGSGAVLAMMLAGMVLIRRLGYHRVLRIGVLTGAAVFFGLILAGLLKSPILFVILVFALGVSTGLSAASMLTAAIEFTTPARAGLLLGLWGLAHELGQAIGSLMGGAVVDLMRALTGGDILASYGIVFAAEAMLLLLAVRLARGLNLRESAIFRAEAHGLSLQPASAASDSLAPLA
ncbi:BCD family MFS transporter [Thermoflexus sp.]|uniref:BCD family MFS transporter n=1 Tax=Thermoflexus sp. TaxID=1969742 RepID=UPI002ADE0FD2|nr:BCD family MFS transporter [Thermoflexus sp.]